MLLVSLILSSKSDDIENKEKGEKLESNAKLATMLTMPLIAGIRCSFRNGIQRSMRSIICVMIAGGANE